MPTHDHIPGHHKHALVNKDLDKLIDELLNRACVFTESQNRSHQHFQTFTTEGSIFMKVNKKSINKINGYKIISHHMINNDYTK